MSGSYRERKDEMAKRREGADGRVVPQGRRKPTPIPETGGGKATTASQPTNQLQLLFETADSPKGAVPGDGRDQSRSRTRYAVPKSKNASSPGSSTTMTMEEVASDANLRWAFVQVERNDGAPGPDGQSVQAVRQHLDHI